MRTSTFACTHQVGSPSTISGSLLKNRLPMPVHVTLHDVSPAFDAEIEVLLSCCHARGIRPGLLVVPNYHGVADLRAAPRYVARLRALQASGHQVFLHGYFHQARKVPMTARRLFRQRIVSAGEAEFADVSEDEGTALLERGMQLFAELGLRIDGFVAPAWSILPWLHSALKNKNVDYTETHLRVYNPVRGLSRASMVYNFASRSVPRIASTSLFCRVARPLSRLLPSRLALHPGDVRSPLLRNELASALDWAAPQAIASAHSLLE